MNTPIEFGLRLLANGAVLLVVIMVLALIGALMGFGVIRLLARIVDGRAPGQN